MKYLLRCFLPTLLFPFLLAMPTGSCVAQQNTFDQDTSTEVIAPPIADDEYDEEEEDTGTVLTDVVPYSRVISADTIAAFKKNASFAYMGYLDSMLRANEKTRQAQPPKEEMVQETPSIWDTSIVKLLCYLVAIGLVGFVIYKLFVSQGLFFKNKKTTAALPEVELAEAVNESDLEKALRIAISKKDYRLGIRYLFLMTLQRLGDKGALQLSTDKTNYQYATELAGKRYAAQFAQLSLQYEYVWFGNFNINESQFSALQQQHQQFLKEI